MGRYLGLLLLGLVVGIFGTLIGAGGGFMLSPILLLLYPQESPETITSISLAVTFVNALSGSVAYARMKRINYQYGLIFAAVSVPSAILGALTTYYVPRRAFDLLFAILLLIVAVIIFLKTPTDRTASKDAELQLASHEFLLGIGISLIVGFVSSFIGIGGGIIHVPALSNLLYFPIHIATATSHFILAIVTFVGTLVHIFTGAFQHGIRRSLALSLGVLIGAQIGATFSTKVKGKLIIRALAVALLLVALRLFVMVFWEYQHA